MKNLFLIKNLINFFSFGKDSIYFYYKNFYKKNKKIFINYNLINIKKIFFKIYKTKIFFIKKFFYNEIILRRIKISIIKNKINYLLTTNHYIIDKIENILIKLIKKKKQYLILNNWYFRNIFFLKPMINIFTKNYKLNIIDKFNKYVFIERNFIRCLISKFF